MVGDNLKTDAYTWLPEDDKVFELLDATQDTEYGTATQKGQVCLIGPPQSGKTRLVHEWCNRQKTSDGRPLPIVSVAVSLNLSEDISGYPYREGHRAQFTQPPIIPTELLEGPKGDYCIFLDEIDKATDSGILNSLLTLLNQRLLRNTQLFPRIIVCAANAPKRPFPEALMARLLFIPYPPKGYPLLSRASLRDLETVLEDIYPEPEPEVPNLDLWAGAAHRLSAWWRDPRFWVDGVAELVLGGSFPGEKAAVILERMKASAEIDAAAWAQTASAPEVTSEVVAILMAATLDQRELVLNTLHHRAQADPTGELGRALQAWINSPTAQAVTDIVGAGYIDGRDLAELADKATAEVRKHVRKLEQESKV